MHVRHYERRTTMKTFPLRRVSRLDAKLCLQQWRAMVTVVVAAMLIKLVAGKEGEVDSFHS